MEVVETGTHNYDAGPDFLSAKVRINGVLWAGNVEIHLRASDWRRHGHQDDDAYANVVLHVVEKADEEVYDRTGRRLPCLELPVPAHVREGHEELLREERFPPCYRIIPSLPSLIVHSWLSALQAERLEEKARRVEETLRCCEGDWERACFITLARNFGFGVNGEAFEEWARRIPLMAAGKHRDNAFQIEALFLGQAGLLDEEAVPEAYLEEARRDGYRARLEKEYLYLAHKFSLQPMKRVYWRFLRMRPQNFPHIRLSQMATLYLSGAAGLMALMECNTVGELRKRLAVGVSPYWEEHYTFGAESAHRSKTLQERTINLIIINTVAPLLFAWGRHKGEGALQTRAFEFLESLPAESNRVVRSWQEAGISPHMAADSQALIQLSQTYCQKRRCLDCRFGYEYLAYQNKIQK